MAAQLLLSPIGILIQQLANNGQPLSGGQIFIYQAGTTTPQTTYTDSTGATPNANPIVLNSAGRLPNVSVWVPSGTPHKLVLQDSNGVTLATIDQLYGINDPSFISQVFSTLPTSGGTANAQTVTNGTPISSQANGIEQWFNPGVANTAATNINVDALGNMPAHYLGKALTGGELQPGVPVLIKSDGTNWNLAWSAKGPVQDYYVDSGTANALVVSVNMAQATQGSTVGTKIRVKAANTNTSPNVTINVNGTTFNVVSKDGTNGPAPGQIVAGLVYEFIAFGVTVTYALQNPSRATGSATLTIATGLMTIPTFTLNYYNGEDGRTVFVNVPTGANGVSNSTTMTITGVPSAIQPGSSKNFPARLQDNSTTPAGTPYISTGTAGTWTPFINTAGTGGFTAANNKGLLSCQASFTLD